MDSLIPFCRGWCFFHFTWIRPEKIPESDQVVSRFLNIVPLLLSSLLVVYIYIYVYYIIMIWLVVSIIFCFPEYMG